jgi:hypothetical protein
MFRASSFMEKKTNFSILGGWYGLLPRFKHSMEYPNKSLGNLPQIEYQCKRD